SPSDAKTVEPQLEVSDYAAVVYDPDAGYADPIATAHGFAAAAAVEGAKSFAGHTMAALATRTGHVTGIKLRGGKSLACERVVVAAGNWTPQLVANAGPRLPLRFVRGDVAILRRPVDFGPPPKIHFDFYGNTYSRPEGDKDTLCGYMDTDPRKTARNHELGETLPSATVPARRALPPTGPTTPIVRGIDRPAAQGRGRSTLEEYERNPRIIPASSVDRSGCLYRPRGSSNSIRESAPSTKSRWKSRRARCSACSGRTARARRLACGSSRGSPNPTPARPRSAASTSGPPPTRCGGSWGSSSTFRSRTRRSPSEGTSRSSPRWPASRPTTSR